MLQLYISVPLAGFRVAQAREYWETYPCPPPATVYGMLLSLVGQENRLVHAGAELAIGLLSSPEKSTVLRTAWRVKDAKTAPGEGENRRPEFVELLSGVRFTAWLRRGAGESDTGALAECVASALRDPRSVARFGALSLGESTHLVDEVRLFRASDPPECNLLIQEANGNLSLPVWPDHVGSIRTRWAAYAFRRADTAAAPPPEAWTRIMPL